MLILKFYISLALSNPWPSLNKVIVKLVLDMFVWVSFGCYILECCNLQHTSMKAWYFHFLV
jgi:hypothetical protein